MTARVHGGAIQVDAEGLPEGVTMTVLAHEGDETFALDAAEEARLLSAIAESERGEVITASRLLQQIRST